MQERLIHRTMIIVADHQSPKVSKPADRSFNLPTSAVATELPSVLNGWPDPALSVRANQLPALLPQALAEGIAVVGSIGDQRSQRSARRLGLLHGFFNQRHFGRRGRRGRACQRNSLAISHHHPLCTLSTFGFSHVVAPFFAGEKLASTKISSQFRSPCSSSSSKNVCQISTRTPASAHSFSRLQQVLGDGKQSGRSFHRAPERSTHKIPSRQARSSARGRPPRGDGSTAGKNGLTRSHCLSVNKTSRVLGMADSFRLPVQHFLQFQKIPISKVLKPLLQ